MKKVFASILILSFISSFSQAEEAITLDGKKVILYDDGTWIIKDTLKTIYSIEHSSKPYYLLDDSTNEFEKAKAKYEAKVKGLGYGGVESYLTVFDEKSKIRFNNSIPKIIFKYDGDIEPSDLFMIVKAKKSPRKIDRRRFIQNSIALGGNTRDTSDNEISYSVNIIEHNIYELTINQVLDEGEYAIIPALNNGSSAVNYNLTSIIYCFGID